jgi:hypothetical protein
MPRRKLVKSQSLVRGLPLHAYIIQFTTSHSGNATLAFFTLVLFFILYTANTDLGIGVAPPAHPQSLFDPTIFFVVQATHIRSARSKDSTSVPRHQSETVHQQFGAACGKSIFQSLLIHPISDMVNTRSSHLLRPPQSAPGASNDSELREFLKNMAESMEVLRKQNEELNTRLTVAEARSSQKERERVERHEKER